MRISFDLDDTLIPSTKDFELEKRSLFAQLMGIEEIRKGTGQLFQQLKSQGNEIWIYTSSFRSKNRIRKTFLSYGIRVDAIINQKMNLEKMKQHGCSASKNPSLFGIDIHIDDSKGVAMEGRQYGFKTIILAPEDENWTATVLSQLGEY